MAKVRPLRPSEKIQRLQRLKGDAITFSMFMGKRINLDEHMIVVFGRRWHEVMAEIDTTLQNDAAGGRVFREDSNKFKSMPYWTFIGRADTREMVRMINKTIRRLQRS